MRIVLREIDYLQFAIDS